MRNGRLRVAAGGASALAALALAACSGSGDAAGSGTSLTWFIATQPGGTVQEISKRCSQQSNGRYTIEPELLPTDASQAREQLVRRLGAEDDTIDIIGMDVIWTAEFANAGWLREWQGPEAREVTKGVFDSVVESASFEGKLYGAPFNSNTQLLWYRKDLVGQAPATWDEMLAESRRIGRKGTIQLQASFYEGLTVWFNAMVESAGTQILAGPEELELAQRPTEQALATMGRVARSDAAATDFDTSDEDTARLGFEGGDAAFMLNYTFAFASAKENAPEIAKQMGAAKYPQVVPGEPSAPPLGGYNIGVSEFSDNAELAFEAAACLASSQSQLTATKLDGLPPTRESLYEHKTVRQTFPGFADLVRESIDAAAPRPLTPAYTDLSLAIQRTLHPVADIDPDDPAATYERLRSALEDAVEREGLL